MEQMFINAASKDEVRVAICKDKRLYDLDIESPGQDKKKAQIYKARITRLEPSLEAAFVDFGSERHGFLPLKEIASSYQRDINDNKEERPNIKDLLKEGQEILIQVEKEERGNKGAALTTYITLAGAYLVLMPNNPRAGGISRQIEGEERDELRAVIDSLEVPNGMSIIVRTAGVGKSKEDMQWDLDILVKQWDAIQAAYKKRQAPFLIQKEDVVMRSLRDNFRRNIDEVVIDDEATFIAAKQYIEQVKPDFVDRVKFYNGDVPLFTKHRIESQIETAYQREVRLPSGGSIVIDPTEALVSIDINSAKSTAGPDIETTALNNNLEAADEIARQLRLRDLGGLVVIDFIDMSSTRNQREVENRLREAMRQDRARVQIGRISRFGLLEMSRQRLRLSLGEVQQNICQRCNGRGTVRTIPALAQTLIRLLEEEAIKDSVAQIQLQVPMDLATFLMNEKRHALNTIERRQQTQVLIIANPYLQAPDYNLTTLSAGELPSRTKNSESYTLVTQPELEIVQGEAPVAESERPAVSQVVTPQRPQAEPGILGKVWRFLFQGSSESKKSSKRTQNRSGQQQRRSQQARTQGSSQRRGKSNNRNRRRRGGSSNKRQNNSGSERSRAERNETATSN